MRDVGLYFATVMIWGLSWIGIRYQLGHGVEVEQTVLYRYIGAALIIQLIVMTRRSARAPLRAHVWFAAMGVTIFSMNYVLVYTAIGLGLTSGLAAVVYSLLILMNALNTAIFFREAPGLGAVLAAPLGLAGIACLFWREIEAVIAGQGGDLGVALLLSIGGVYCASLGNMASRKLQGMGQNVMTANGWAMSYAVMALLAWEAAQGRPLAFSTAPEFLISLTLLVVFSTVLAFWAYLTLLGRIGADRAAYAFVAFPVVALVVSSLVENFVWTELRIAGVALVLAGNVVLLAGRRRPEPRVVLYRGGGGAPGLRLSQRKTPGA